MKGGEEEGLVRDVVVFEGGRGRGKGERREEENFISDILSRLDTHSFRSFHVDVCQLRIRRFTGRRASDGRPRLAELGWPIPFRALPTLPPFLLAAPSIHRAPHENWKSI